MNQRLDKSADQNVTTQPSDNQFPARIVSGGQTGVDRAALDVALSLGWPCGGWCPRGRRAEDGRIDPEYPLQETESRNYAVRTQLNVAESDGTLILCCGRLTKGTSLTRKLAIQEERPFLVCNLVKKPAATEVAEWIESNRIAVLNVAGPRESSVEGIHQLATAFLRSVLEHCRT